MLDFDNIPLEDSESLGEDYSLDLKGDSFVSDLLDSLPMEDSGDDIYSFSEDEEDVQEFSLVASDEEEDLDLSILLDSSIDVVSVLSSYLKNVSTIIQEAVPPAESESERASKYHVDYSDFQYMPETVFSVFSRMLVDFATVEDYAELSVSEALNLSLELLIGSTQAADGSSTASVHWTPKLNYDEYAASFKKYFERFRKISSSKNLVKQSTIFESLDLTECEGYETLYKANTQAFNIVTVFFNDETHFVEERKVQKTRFPNLCEEYLNQRVGNNLILPVARDAILSYFNSEDFIKISGLSRDDILSFSLGELLRRCILYELDKGLFRIGGVNQSNRPDPQTMYQFLNTYREQDGVSMELITAITDIMLQYDQYTNGKTRYARDFLYGIHLFLLMDYDEPAYVRPVFYGSVVHQNNKYVLGYTDGKVSYTVESEDPLCTVYGTMAKLYCYPRAYIDTRNDLLVCPPLSLVASLSSLPKSNSNKLSIVFEFKPNIGWLQDNYVIAEDYDHVDDNTSIKLSTKSSSFLQVLVDYDNDFIISEKNMSPIIITRQDNNSILYLVPQLNSNNYSVAAITSNDEINPMPFVGKGSLLYDGDTVIVQTISALGELDDFTFNKNDAVISQIEYDEKHCMDNVPYNLFINDRSYPADLNLNSYRSAVQEICDMANLEFSEEMEFTSKVISQNLFFVLGVYSVNSLVANRIMGAFLNYMQIRKKSGQTLLDAHNFSTMQELLEIIVGTNNCTKDKSEWDDSILPSLQKEMKENNVTLHSICSMLDGLNFDVLALQALSVSRATKEINVPAFKAFIELPGVSSRIEFLQLKMIVLRAFDSLGSHAPTVFYKYNPLKNSLKSEITAANCESAANALKSEMRKFLKVDDGRNLVLTQRVVSETIDENTIILKYFILERNAYSLLSMLHDNDSYKTLYNRMIVYLGLPDGYNISLVTQDSFNLKYSKETIGSLFTEFSDVLDTIVIRGLISEVISNNQFSVIRAYDLFNTYYKVLFSTSIGDADEDNSSAAATGEPITYKPFSGTFSDNRENFVNYAASMVVSYCPIIDSAANAVDAGEDHTVVFATNTSDFIYDSDITGLVNYKLDDLRNVSDFGADVDMQSEIQRIGQVFKN